MIPRTRANFTMGDLLSAATHLEGAGEHRGQLGGQLARYLGVSGAVPTPSGRAGLLAILSALEQPKVLVPAYTCNAVVEAATLANKEIVFVDSTDGFNMAPDALGDLADKDTVVLATHQFGLPCAIAPIVELAHDRGALVVEDAAASLGTRVDGRPTGTFGDAAFFSFDVSKLITVPLKGGAIVARDARLLERIRRAHLAQVEPMPAALKAKLLLEATALIGIQGPARYRLFHRLKFGEGKFTDESSTLNLTRTMHYRYELSDWQAAIASRQLTRIEWTCQRRRALYEQYRQRLSGCRSFLLPPADVLGEWAPVRFPIRVRTDKLAFYREAIQRGVDFAFSFTFIAAPATFTLAHGLAASVLDLPFYTGLTTGEMEQVVETLVAIDRLRRPREIPC